MALSAGLSSAESGRDAACAAALSSLLSEMPSRHTWHAIDEVQQIAPWMDPGKTLYPPSPPVAIRHFLQGRGMGVYTILDKKDICMTYIFSNYHSIENLSRPKEILEAINSA